MRRFWVSAVFGLAATLSANAEVVALTSLKDNTLFEDPTGLYSNGAGQYMFVGETRAANSRRGVLMFDIASAVPAGSIINSATLQMHCSRSVSGSRTVTMHQLLADWGEGTSDSGDPGGGGAFSTPGDATWQHRFFDSTSWTTPGGDYDAAISSQTNFSGEGYYTFPSTAPLVADVQGFLDNPATNFGWLLHGPEDGGTSAKRLDTRENANLSFRPKLVVEYTIPEPATGLLLIVGAGLLRRRG